MNSSLISSACRIFRKHCACGREATALCDWKVAEHKTGTCDTPVCDHHGKPVANGTKRICPTHQKEYDGWKARHRKFTEQEQQSLFSEAA
jgi:hypothetical protein